jgi:hypothetical protein
MLVDAQGRTQILLKGWQLRVLCAGWAYYMLPTVAQHYFNSAAEYRQLLAIEKILKRCAKKPLSRRAFYHEVRLTPKHVEWVRRLWDRMGLPLGEALSQNQTAPAPSPDLWGHLVEGEPPPVPPTKPFDILAFQQTLEEVLKQAKAQD